MGAGQREFTDEKEIPVSKQMARQMLFTRQLVMEVDFFIDGNRYSSSPSNLSANSVR